MLLCNKILLGLLVVLIVSYVILLIVRKENLTDTEGSVEMSMEQESDRVVSEDPVETADDFIAKEMKDFTSVDLVPQNNAIDLSNMGFIDPEFVMGEDSRDPTRTGNMQLRSDPIVPKYQDNGPFLQPPIDKQEYRKPLFIGCDPQ